MKVYTDKPSFADSLLGKEPKWERCEDLLSAPPLERLAGKLLSSGPTYSTSIRAGQFWEHSFLIEKAANSQFDLLAEALEATQGLPDGILCCAGSGGGFHGQHQRPWAAEKGNVHLSAVFRPDQDVANCGIGFTVVAVVSVLQVLDTLEIPQAGVKWVNDILVRKAKVGGVLVRTRTQGTRVTSALIGIGLNVERTPSVEPTPFVPSVASLRQFSDSPNFCSQGDVFRKLAAKLAENYRRFIQGGFSELLDVYRNRSIILGKSVAIYEESDNKALTKIAGGKVKSIGDNLELSLEGETTPVWRGRLCLEGKDHHPSGKE